MAQVVECLSRKQEALSSTPSTPKKKKTKPKIKTSCLSEIFSYLFILLLWLTSVSNLVEFYVKLTITFNNLQIKFYRMRHHYKSCKKYQDEYGVSSVIPNFQISQDSVGNR
jgi:hypothetical protein